MSLITSINQENIDEIMPYSHLKKASCETLSRKALCVAEQSQQISKAFDPEAYYNIPRFVHSELNVGNVIGRGGFCVVHELYGLDLNRKFQPTSATFTPESVQSSDEEDDIDPPMTREALAKRAKKNGNRQYCLKLVTEELSQQKRNKVTYLKGTVDLIMESKFLASLSHNNILQIRGISATDSTNSKVFLILDRLRETFSSRMRRWMQKDRRNKSVALYLIGKAKQKQEKLLNVRLQAAYDIADVMGYLHSKNIIYRDLKPDNIGFDENDNLKIFDFGLAKELKLENMDRDTGCYHLTAFTGAIRYMAPEVGLKKPYNLKADVYSWAILMWYILALEPPYGCFTIDMIVDRVFKRGVRPAPRADWSENLSSLLKRCWNFEINARPTFLEIKNIVRQDLVGTGKGRENESCHTSPSSQGAPEEDSCSEM